MNKTTLLEYKGYTGSSEVSLADGVLIGKIECINDLILFEGETVPELRADFEAAVDDYLEMCKKVGKTPDKAMSGTFNVRIGPERHKKAYLKSVEDNISINRVIKTALDVFFGDKQEIHLHNHTHTVVHDSQIPVENWDTIQAEDYQVKSVSH